MTAFNKTELTQNRILVDGTDRLGFSGRTVLDATQFNEMFQHGKQAEAAAAFDAEIEAFYAPITAAIDAYESAVAAAEEEDLFEVVVQEGVDATPGQPELRVRLTPDTVILRLIEQGESDRLIWVNDKLEITAPVAVEDAGQPVEAEDEIVPIPVDTSEPTA